MAWLQSILDTENSTGLELVLVTLSLAIVLILVFWVIRKIMGNPARRAARNRVPRLSVTDAAVVDDKRRLVLVRRDDVEHLVMIGGPTDVVIESNVNRMQPAAMPPVAETQAPAPGTSAGKRPPNTDNEPVQPKVEDRKSVSESAAAATAVAGTAAIASQTKTDKPAEASKPQEPAADKVAVEFKKEAPEPAKADAEAAKPEPAEPALDELENTISAGLDDALADIAPPEPAQNQNEQPAPPLDDAGPENAENMDDEMQRLLDELAEETKETA